MEPREPLRDRETEPRIRRAGERILPPRREGLGKLFLRQARPVVADGELAAAAELSQPEDDLPAVAGAADAVGDEDEQELLELALLADHEKALPAGSNRNVMFRRCRKISAESTRSAMRSPNERGFGHESLSSAASALRSASWLVTWRSL